MGRIHLAVVRGLADFRKLLVIKELRQDLTRNQRFVEMFLDEAKLAARLNHPNVVQTIEAGQEGERYFLSMEFLDGQPLSALLARADQDPRAPLPILVRILCDTLAGLHYAHELTDYDGTRLSIVHRDVSPQNIFVTYDGQVKVVDFGIAKAAVGENSTSPGVFKGKFGYAAPEQVRGIEVDQRTDLFAVGVILWEALTGRRFADGPVTRNSVMARLYGSEPRLSQLSPKVDPRLASICDRALQLDPADRFSSAEEFRLALEGYLSAVGQRPSDHAMRKLMGAKFAEERKAIHRLIDSHIKRGPNSELRTVDTAQQVEEPGNDNPTTVADMSRYLRAHETSVSRIDASGMPLSRSARMKRAILIGAVLALVVIVSGYAGWSSRRAEEPVQPAVVALPIPQPSTPASPSHAVLETTPETTPENNSSPAGSDTSPSRVLPVHKAVKPRPVAITPPPTAAGRPESPTPVQAEPVRAAPSQPDLGGDLRHLTKPSDRIRSIDTTL